MSFAHSFIIIRLCCIYFHNGVSVHHQILHEPFPRLLDEVLEIGLGSVMFELMLWATEESSGT